MLEDKTDSCSPTYMLLQDRRCQLHFHCFYSLKVIFKCLVSIVSCYYRQAIKL